MYKKFLQLLTLKSDIINTVLGIILIISLAFIYHNPENKVAIFLACCAGGLINIVNGIKIIKEPIRKMTGMTFIMMGIMLIVLGYILIIYFIK